MRIRHRLLTFGTALITFFAVLMYPSVAAAAHTGDTEKGAQSQLQAAPGVQLLWKKQDGSTEQMGDFTCADTGTCITCEVGAIPPWQDAVSPIINFRGEVYCYQPNQNNRPAPVPLIQIQLGLWNFLDGRWEKATPPYQLHWDYQLGLTDAMPMKCGVWQTVVFVFVMFPECCPLNASDGFGSEVRRIGC